MTIGCWLLTVDCGPLTIYCWLLTADYWLLIFNCWLSTFNNYRLWIINYQLLIIDQKVFCSLFWTHKSLLQTVSYCWLVKFCVVDKSTFSTCSLSCSYQDNCKSALHDEQLQICSLYNSTLQVTAGNVKTSLIYIEKINIMVLNSK